jgi:hypothetical protein
MVIPYGVRAMLRHLKYFCVFVCLVLEGLSVTAAVVITPKESARQWEVAEFSISGVPQVSNPFDPDQIAVHGTFIGPSGKSTGVDGFWYQDYRATLSGSSEVLTVQGAPEWRLRFTPDEIGTYKLNLQITTTTGSLAGVTTFDSAAAANTNRFKGFVKIAANRRYFEIAGEPLPLNGANVCWHGSRGTFDYIDWFSAMHTNGENYARLWMCPWAFGIEAQPATRTNYKLDRAWQLDQTIRLAKTNGIFLMLCLEYHGMLQTQPDQFGGNNGWKDNPYNTANGGPCATPNDFFTSITARDIYKKRLLS